MTAPFAYTGKRSAQQLNSGSDRTTLYAALRQASTSMNTDIDTIYIGGEWVTPLSTHKLEIQSPATGEREPQASATSTARSPGRPTTGWMVELGTGRPRRGARGICPAVPTGRG